MFDFHTSAARLDHQIPSAELAIETAMLGVAEVMSTSLQTKTCDRVTRATKHTALLRLQKTMEGLMSAQGDILRFHGQLRDIAVTASPDHPWCPEDGAKGARPDAPVGADIVSIRA
ncbi:hypothetical protein MKP08_11745 [Erythrobacter sp. LQ02-29]|uniref:hypothetical protein n=1 Tax=Erythrobacter sp. LQ02-29 TaxID=2920384 RepID=UPI001F4D78EF|nr:hypothetical protein [Erythrobacter sp. LQ02-29]MCP9223420.1 hypothetical protein [Erythrobacter sp. LQ02-29]